ARTHTQRPQCPHAGENQRRQRIMKAGVTGQRKFATPSVTTEAVPSRIRGEPTAVPRYGVALLSVALALLLQWTCGPLLAPTTSLLLFLGAVLAGAWYGGLGPGLLATLLGGLLGSSLLSTAAPSLPQAEWGQGLPLLGFLVEGGLISGLGERLRLV